MKKETTEDKNNNNNIMSAAVESTNPNDGDGYYRDAGSVVSASSGTTYHHPAYYSYSNQQPMQQYPPPDGYSAQYMHPPYQTYAPSSGAPPLPPTHHQQHYQPHLHPAPPQAQPMYYGSWPGGAASTQSAPPNNQHYGSAPYQSILPPEASGNNRNRRPSSAGANNVQPVAYGMYGQAQNDNLISALHHIKRNPNATLFDIQDIIPDIACFDEGGSRFIHKRLKLGTIEEQELAMKVALSAIEELWSHHFGNFMLQGIFEFGTDEMKKELMEYIYNTQDVAALCVHMNGCRVIQKAIRCLAQEDVSKLILEFHDKVIPFTHDPNGNHVIQRSIQVMSSFAKMEEAANNPDIASSLSDEMQFIIDDIVNNTESLSSHRYGCRVVQRAIEHCVDDQKNEVLEKIISCHKSLVVDQYGNYVIQQVLVCGSEDHLSAILKTLTENDALLKFSKHKYASNVVEAILEHGKPDHKETILKSLLKDTRDEKKGGYCCVIELSKDSIANYVVNKAIEVSKDELREDLFEVIESSRPELSKSQYGKYVLQKLDKCNTKQAT